MLSTPHFRQACFGAFSGAGSLASYLHATLVRDAFRLSAREKRSDGAGDGLDDAAQGREISPDESAGRTELRTQIADALRGPASDPGLVPFLLQQALEMTVADVAGILGVKENAVRQRTFRFRERFRRAWRRKHPRSTCPFSAAGERAP